MPLDLGAVLADLAARRPVFHSERDFQHELAWQVRLRHPEAEVRLEPRPRRGVRLDLLVRISGQRLAVEVKYFVQAFHGSVHGEAYDFPSQGAHDIGRHDVVKDIARVETLLRDGYADAGFTVTLTNDANYWRPGTHANPIDAAFRLHEGRVLTGDLTWAAHAGAGTTSGRAAPLLVAGRYQCHWRDYSQVSDGNGRVALFRFLLLAVSTSTAKDLLAGRAPDSVSQPTPTDASVTPRGPTHAGAPARDEILDVARRLADQAVDGSFTLAQVLAEMRRAGTRYAESTIRTHVTSRMCADAPDHHATTFDDLERLGYGRYSLRSSEA